MKAVPVSYVLHKCSVISCVKLRTWTLALFTWFYSVALSGVSAAAEGGDTYNMTVRFVFETPAGPQTEELTVSIHQELKPAAGGGPNMYSDTRKGQAKVFTFPNGIKVAILLPNLSAKMAPTLRLALKPEHIRAVDRLDRFKSLDEPIAIREKQWPWVVTFEDRHNPITVRRITNESIAELLGSDYRMLSAEIMYTTEKVNFTDEVFDWLPWLKDWDPYIQLDGDCCFHNFAEFPDANRLGRRSFHISR